MHTQKRDCVRTWQGDSRPQARHSSLIRNLLSGHLDHGLPAASRIVRGQISIVWSHSVVSSEHPHWLRQRKEQMLMGSILMISNAELSFIFVRVLYETTLCKHVFTWFVQRFCPFYNINSTGRGLDSLPHCYTRRHLVNTYLLSEWLDDEIILVHLYERETGYFPQILIFWIIWLFFHSHDAFYIWLLGDHAHLI